MRDTSLDILRGMMLVIMTIDHFEGPLMAYTWETLGFVSAAEGFVFLSGYLAGLVYGKYGLRDPALLRRRGFARAWTIYKYHAVLVVAVCVFTVLATTFAFQWRSYALEFETQPLQALLLGLVFVYQAPLLDILPMYTLFLLLTPAMIGCFRTGKTYLVVLISVSLWLLAQLGVRDALYQALGAGPLIDLGHFDIFAWQALFVAGCGLGYRRLTRMPSDGQNSHRLIWLVFPVFAFLLLVRHEYVDTLGWNISEITDRSSLAWLRMLNFACVVYVMGWLLARKHQLANLRRGFRWLWTWLAFLGRHSLQVFAFQVFLAYLLIPVKWGLWTLDEPVRSPVQIAVTLLVVISLSIPAVLHRTRPSTVPTRSYPMSQPGYSTTDSD